MASGDTLVVLGPYSNEPPATVYATLDMRNSRPCLDFDQDAVEAAVFSFILPRHYAGSGITVYLHWAATSATTGNVIWRTSFERTGQDIQDADADSFATAVTWSAQATSATDGNIVIDDQGHTNGAQIDSIVVGELCRLKIERVGTDGSDTMTGDAELYAIELKET